jgi:hypothetical protein
MKLEFVRGRLDQRLNRAANNFTEISRRVRRRCRREDAIFLDGLLSYTWQAWCKFCRDLIVHSCLGGETRAGVVLPVTATPPNVERVSYLAIQGNRKKVPAPLVTNAVWRFEPTWGDVAALVRIIPAASPGNAAHLLSTFGGVSTGPAHLQKVRNAVQHLNNQTFAEVTALQIYYLSAPIRFPSEAAFWVDNSSGDYAFLTWIDEMRFLASDAVA